MDRLKTAAIAAAEFRMKHALFAVVGSVAGLIFNGPTHSETLVPVEPQMSGQAASTTISYAPTMTTC